VEEEYNPVSHLASGPSRNNPKYQTAAGSQAAEATSVSVPEFGANLRKKGDGKMNYDNIVAANTQENASNWNSVTSSAFGTPSNNKPTEFSTTFQLKGGMTDPNELAEYRGRWSQEKDSMRGERFRTENTVTQNSGVPANFKARTIRNLPGVPLAVEKVREKVAKRGKGIRGLGRTMRIFDNDGSGKLSRDEFKFGLRDYGVEISEADVDNVIKYFDRDGDGSLDYNELIRGIRGVMNERRLGLVSLAFAVLDKTDDGQVTIEDLQGVYDTSMHPDVISGKITENEALEDFMEQWDTLEKDGIVTGEEFVEYYKDVSASIDDDDYFELMIRNAWKIAGGSNATVAYDPTAWGKKSVAFEN
jgi:Ca2+-binding EF-hand superfamily protein